MDRNTENAFSLSPNINIGRSRLPLDHDVKTTFNVGELIPFEIFECLPGDTYQVNTSKVVRMQSLLTPVMDNLFLDTYYFFVPMRLLWDHWKEFCGENTESAWIPQTEYTIPQISPPVESGSEVGFDFGTIADYFGIPPKKTDFTVSSLPFRAYALICNEFFRDENLSDPLVVPTDDSDVVGSNGDSYVTDVAKGGKPFLAAKTHDYFTSCLPAPQKGPDVTIPVGEAGLFPVYSLTQSVPAFPDMAEQGYSWTAVTSQPYKWSSVDYHNELEYRKVQGDFDWVQEEGKDPIGQGLWDGGSSSSDPRGMTFNNLYAYDSGDVSLASINQLRLAFQIQKFYEKQARGGSRYTELIRSFFGVTSPDARLQRPEYLGGTRVPININQVIQQSETATTPQGHVTGMSVTADNHSDFVKSFTEHGYIIGLCVARYNHTYQTGLHRMWSRKDKFDFYWPTFANIGEQAVLNKEIYLAGDSTDDNEVFGYQEAWSEYRHLPNRVCNEMRSSHPTSLDVWHFADNYAERPYLSDEWIREDLSNVDRTLAVQSNTSCQLFMDCYIHGSVTRAMPVHSIPGYIDHF